MGRIKRNYGMNKVQCSQYMSYMLGGSGDALLSLGIEKYLLPEKKFGLFSHYINENAIELFRGFNEVFFALHSLYTEIKKEDILYKGLKVFSESEEAGIYIAGTADLIQFL